MRLFLDVEFELVRGPVMYTVGIRDGDFKRVEFLPDGTCLVGGERRGYELIVTPDEAAMIRLFRKNRDSILFVGFPDSLEHARFEVETFGGEVRSESVARREFPSVSR